MKALVVGGAGFIGSHLVDRLLAGGETVDVVDDLSTGSLGNLADARSAGGTLKIHHVDVGTSEASSLLGMRQPDVVFHLAALPRRPAGPLALGRAFTTTMALLEGVRVHQMHAIRDRPYLAGAFGERLRHVSYFLSHVTRPHFAAGTIDLVPNNFSEMRNILRDATDNPLVIAAASVPDRHGYFSLGLNADYVSSFIGRARFFLEANRQVLGSVDDLRRVVEKEPAGSAVLLRVHRAKATVFVAVTV